MTVVLWKWTDRGFFSEFNSMLLAKSYSDLLGLRFMLTTTPGNAFESSWARNFVPFCETFEHRLTNRLTSLDENPGKQILDSIAMSFAVTERALIPSVVFSNTLTPIYESALQTKAIDPLKYLNQCFNSVWKFKPEVSIRLQRAMADLFRGSADVPYHGIHIRRGDKNDFEAASIEVEKYIEKLDFSHVKAIYVASDEYLAVTQAREYLKHRGESDVIVYSLCRQDMHGYHQSKFNELSDSQKQFDITLLLTEFEILRNANTFVGSFTSNVGRAVHIARAGRDSFSADVSFSLCFDPYSEFRRSNGTARLLASILC